METTTINPANWIQDNQDVKVNRKNRKNLTFQAVGELWTIKKITKKNLIESGTWSYWKITSKEFPDLATIFDLNDKPEQPPFYTSTKYGMSRESTDIIEVAYQMVMNLV